MKPRAHVLVTRPAGQADTLVEALHRRGWRATHQPAIRIEPLPLSEPHRGRLLDLDQYHAAIFVSINAVQYAANVLADFWPQWPQGVHWLAVGEATAEALRKEGLEPDLPDHGFNSEALLELPCLQTLREKSILIFSGDTGRTLLRDTLSQRGARVDVLPLYRRVCAPFAWPEENVDVLMVTSVESWNCLAGAVPADVRIVAGSARIADVIRARGYKTTTARSPHDADMIDALDRL